MNVYYRNYKAILTEPKDSYVDNIYDPIFELVAEFNESKVTIKGDYGLGAAAVDSVCLGYTNAFRYELKTNVKECSCEGSINDRITIFNFDDVSFINCFELTLESVEKLYLGHLFLGMRTVLPRFEVGHNSSKQLFSERNTSFGGQAFGVRRKTLKNFSVNFPRITSEEKEVFDEYIDTVLNIEPHIIDPYEDARDKFPPMYTTLNISDIASPKLKEDGFFYSLSLAWQEAR